MRGCLHGKVALCTALATRAMISACAAPEEQGSAMGNNQSLQMGSEALSGLVGGLLAAIFLRLPYMVWTGCALFAALILIAAWHAQQRR